LFIDGALMNRQYWNKQDHPIIISKDLHISEEVLDNILQRKGLQANSTRADILQVALRQLK